MSIEKKLQKHFSGGRKEQKRVLHMNTVRQGGGRKLKDSQVIFNRAVAVVVSGLLCLYTFTRDRVKIS